MSDTKQIDFKSPRRAIAERYPELGTEPIPVEPYVSEKFFEKEREKIFRRYWLLAGRDTSIPNPGDHFLRDMKIVNASVVVARGQDGKVRAFHNVCRHRGCRLVREGGTKKFFACNFHGWVYDNKGALVHVPDESQFFNFDRANYNLAELHTEIWNGFVFVNFAAEPHQTLTEQLGALGVQLKDYPFHEMMPVGRWGANVRVNWKVILDAFQEAYHVATVHSGTLPTYFNGEDNPYARPTSVRVHGRCRSISIGYNTKFEPHPSEGFAASVIGTLTQGDLAAARTPPGINPEGDPNFSFDVNGIWPNWLLDPSAGWFFHHEFWPISHNETRWESTFYMYKPQSASQLLAQEQTIALLRDAFREDLNTNENTQLGLEQGAIDEIIFQDGEAACRHSLRAVIDALSDR